MMPIRAAAVAVTRWKNGAGRKADIAEGPGWNIGYAWLDEDAPFSDFTGHDRTITLVEGPGFTLLTPSDKVAVNVPERFVPTVFDGGLAVRCEVRKGPCRVLNVMTSRAQCHHKVEVLSAGTHRLSGFVVVMHGAAQAGEIPLSRFDALSLNDHTKVTTSQDAILAIVTISQCDVG